MLRHILERGLVVGLACALLSPSARAQAPTVDSSLPASPGTNGSSLGASPGTGAGVLGTTPGGNASMFSTAPGGGPISGRPGATATHVLESAVNPGATMGTNNQQQAYSAPAPQPTYSPPSYGSFEMPAGSDDDGPPDGMTLDQAIERLLKENLDLRGKSMEIPQAEADILSAGLRANPVFYADGQLVPYGQFTKERPGGQTQYDVNVSYPLDISRKRPARTLYATRAKRVIEAQYQDAVRQSVDLLYTAFVNVLNARQTVRYQSKSVESYQQRYKIQYDLFLRDQKNKADVLRMRGELSAAEVGLMDAQEGFLKTKRDLATLLNVAPRDAEQIQVRGTLQDLAPAPPPADELVQMALAMRPDVVSYRLGIRTAEANVRLQLANRLTDVYVLYQPYTFQNNSPFGLKSPMSWALGVTVPMPIYNRNQGGIARAKLNVRQSQLELANLERQVMTDVAQAVKEYEVTGRMVAYAREKVIPDARAIRDSSAKLYAGGEINIINFLDAQKEFQDTVKQYLDVVVRHRKAMLSLNTSVGQRILP